MPGERFVLYEKRTRLKMGNGAELELIGKAQWAPLRQRQNPSLPI